MINFLRVLVKDKKVIILAIFLVLQLSGCSSIFEKSKEVTDWEDEVLMARECGIEGLPCCLDNEEPCEINTTCCFDPNNSDNHECASKCTCGERNNFCCEGNTCGEALACVDNRCKDCGAEGEVCCADNICDDSFLCHQGTCVACGNPNTPCCEGKNKCVKPTDNEARIECISDICKNCGRDGNTPCVTEPFCDQRFFESNNLCHQCGGFNQPCCVLTKESDYICNKEENLSCVDGFCLESEVNKILK